MPLRAIVNNEVIITPFLTEDEWKTLKNRVKTEKLEVILPCCEHPGYLRTSSRGLAHFVHYKKSNDCPSKPETWQHLKAKSEIAKACRNAGWDVVTEASGDGWRADILATLGDTKIAFEVQWSPQTLEETEYRQQKYADSDVRCCWLFKSPWRGFKSRGDLPLFKIEIDNEESNVIFNPYEYDRYGFRDDDNQIFELKSFIQLLLNGKFKFSSELIAKRQQEVIIQFIEIDCWKCKKSYDIYYTSELSSSCGKVVEGDLYFNNKVISEAIKFTQSPQGQHINMGYIKKRYSKTVNESYMSFGCSHCDAICGSFFLHHEIMIMRDMYPIRAVHAFEIDLDEPVSWSYPHWCYSDKRDFCRGQY